MKNKEIRRFKKIGGFLGDSPQIDYIEIHPNGKVYSVDFCENKEENSAVDLEFALDSVIAGEWEELNLIRERVTLLNKKIEEYKKEILQIQDKCKHKNIEKESHADTGNYDPSNDRYWTDFKCLDCDKQWRITKYLND